MIKSKALEVNIADYHVDVTIDPKYEILQDVMSRYYGLMEGLNTFLLELSHPYKNWQFIVKEARNYALNYFHLLKDHPKGCETAHLFIDIFGNAVESANTAEIKADAADNLLAFLLKILKDAGEDLGKFIPVIDGALKMIRCYPDDYFFLFIKSYYNIKRISDGILSFSPEKKFNHKELNLLLIKYLQYAYACWLNTEDPQRWLEEEAGEIADKEKFGAVFRDISHAQLSNWNTRLYLIAQSGKLGSANLTKRLVDLPDYNDIADSYRGIPARLLAAGGEKGSGNQWKVMFLFQIMSVPGLSNLHEEALRDINRTLSWLIENEKYWNIDTLIQKTFSILKDQTNRFPATALNCVVNMGKGIYQTDDSELITLFIESLVNLRFQTPKIRGVGNDWQVEANHAHIQNIRAWLELIKLNPKWSTRLLSCLIIYLSLFGIYIKDTDLFPRDITGLLNSDIEPVYDLIKQLTRLFPAYFNDIGAEGVLREVSTQVDELYHRKDVLIHFLRKQSHVESSNRIIRFMEAVLEFWTTREKKGLKPFLPPSIYSQITNSGIYIDGVHKVMFQLRRLGINPPKDLLTINEKEIQDLLEGMASDPDVDVKRAGLAISLYKLLYQKYSLDFFEIQNYLAHFSTKAFPGLNRLKEALAEPDLKKKLYMLLRYLKMLKKLILSGEVYEIREDIYKKRHITVDIPSMYGSYHETKFDALGLTFRIESLINALFDELIDTINLSLITKATFYQIFAVIRLFDEALKLDGISSVEIERQLDLLAHSLEVKGFTFTQYLDIFKGFARAIKNIINDHFHNIHEQNLNRILSMMPAEELLPKYLPNDRNLEADRLRHRVSEIFFRDQIAHSLGLQQLDVFITRTLNTLFQQSSKLPKGKLHQLLLYDPESAMISINQTDNRVSSIISLGNKGFNMVMLKNFGLPVPSGFIITTEVFRCRQVIDSYPPAENNFKEQVRHHISDLENATDKEFGNPANPLLFSVRSGSPISQPGMMDTLLNVGINEDIVSGIAAKTGNAWFAWDNYRRFLQCYGMSFGLERDIFDDIIAEFKQKLGIPLKRKFTGEQMRAVALGYKNRVREAGFEVEDDPFDQLCQAIKNVFSSWGSDKAETYRTILSISNDWGTAVIIQSMVYGNISPNASGTGVFFTHNPRWSGDTLRLWGDFTVGNQGEDVVSGLVKTMPISIIQQDTEMRDTDITLESHFPEIYSALKDWANTLIYKKGYSPQEMEFTFESRSAKDLYLLQTRDMAMRERKDVLRFDHGDIAKERYLSHGIGVSGGAMGGRVVFSLEEIERWRQAEPDTCLILLRGDTVPDDIREINATDGLLTARGGLTSHAAVIAHRLGKTCVVGCEALICNEKDRVSTINRVLIKSGEFISIDGQEGTIYRGKLSLSNTKTQ
jgi:pyruvate, orthophosphate dikinase